MLIKREVLDKVVSGEIDMIFRRWTKPTVKAGGTLRTSVGMLAIDAIDIVSMASLTPEDAARAGFDSKAALVRELRSRDAGEVHRIHVRHAGEDPRIALRNNADLSAADIAELTRRLDRLDAASTTGPWARSTLDLLAQNPQVRAQDLADGLGLEKKVFKTRVRKLKELGLTVSFSPGYEVSPRGAAYLGATADGQVPSAR